MLKRSLKAMFFLLISLVWHVNAAAQAPQAGFSYAKKAQTISLAKSGDADAFFKLGLAHLHGVGANQNDAVAQRFFFYAAQKGHTEAGQYLIPAKDTVKSPTSAAISVKTPVKSKDTKQKKRAEEKRLKAAERKAKRAKRQAQAKTQRAAARRAKGKGEEQGKKRASVIQVSENARAPSFDPNTDIKSSVIKTPQKTKVAVTTIHELPATSAVRSQTTVNPNITVTTAKKRPATWTYILLTLAALLMMGFIVIQIFRMTKTRNAPPAGFDKRPI